MLAIPPIAGVDDLELQEEIGRRVTEIVIAGDHHVADDRHDVVRKLLGEYERTVASQAAA